jgi:AbrB family looped-hinge helix DNA binding protein
MQMSEIVTLTEDFQIAVPKQVRESQKWQTGQQLAFIRHGSGYVLVPVPTLEELQGMFKGASNADIRDRDDRY